MPRILMLGPDLSVLGGMANVERLYMTHWQYNRYALRHIPTYIQGSQLGKLQVMLWGLWRYIAALATWKPDIIHIHFSERAGFYRESIFALLGRLHGRTVVMHCHSPEFKEFYQAQSSFLQRYTRFVLNHVSLLIVLSPRWQTYFQALPVNAPVQILNNPIEIPDPSLINTKLRDNPVILSLGEIGQRKGTFDTLQIVPSVQAQHPTAAFWLGGDGAVDEVRHKIAGKPWQEQVHLLGWVTGDEKQRVWQSASLFLLPSYAEGLPLAVLEAMSWALPVVTTTVGGLPDLIVHGQNGYLVEPGDLDVLADTINAVLGDTQQAKTVGAKARQTVEQQYDIHVILEDLYRLYRTLLS